MKDFKKELLKNIVIILMSAICGYLIAYWQYQNDRRNTKIDLFVEIKSTTNNLLEEYRNELNAKIDISYYSAMLQNSMATITYSKVDRHSQFFLERAQLEVQENDINRNRNRALLNDCTVKINNLKKSLFTDLEKIQFHFDMEPEIEKAIRAIYNFKIHKFAFKRVNNSKIKNHDMLVKWKKDAQSQGDKYIERYFIESQKTLIKKLEQQI